MGGVTLPAAAWRDHAGLAKLVAALGQGKARIVGGAVRDSLLGLPTDDVDLATVHLPETVIDLLEAARIKAIPTGLAHGTITAVSDDQVYEVTTLRRDVETNGRHAVVAFSEDWREDAARRDFTINALYADPASGEIFDYFGGLDDLKTKRVRFIGDPLARIAEDHLRILRFFRFHARFGDAPDAAGLEACTERANDLMALSRERIAHELLRLLVARHAVAVVRLMIERGIFRAVLPEIASAEALAEVAVREEAAGVAPDAIRRLAALIPGGKVAEDVGARLKMSNTQRKRLAGARQPLGDEGLRGLAWRIGVEAAIDRALLHGEDPSPLFGWTPPPLPISGGALVSRGIAVGPDVARLLKQIEAKWIAEGFPDAARVQEMADAAVAGRL